MSDKGVARRYAKAILDSADGDKALETLCGEISDFSKIYLENAELRKVLIHPGVSDGSKRGIIQGIADKMGLSRKCKELMILVLDKGRVDMLPEIAESLKEMADEKLKKVHVKVSSSHELAKADIERLERVFSSITGKKAELEVRLDKSLIGGIVARIGSKVYDGSIANQLRLMKLKLIQEA